MSYDATARFSAALKPEQLTTFNEATNALLTAIHECRADRCDPQSDPAVLLLARRLGLVALTGKPSDADLRAKCRETVEAASKEHVLLQIARRGIYHDAAAKEVFHREAKKALRRVADALGLAKADYDLRSNQGGPAVSGEITLHTDHAYIQVDLGCMGPAREVMYRTCDGRRDYTGGRNNFASIANLLDPLSFAAHLRQTLRLPDATPAVAA